MERLSRKGANSVSPDMFTNSLMLRIYTSQINRSKVQKKALNFFNKFDFKDLDTYTCNCMLTLLARSTNANNVEKARQLLLDMEERRLANVTSYNTMVRGFL